ncbi:hypothetical protein NCH01_18850 [Neoasaia chiangmaiensis]|nr:hypothetical protein NCH01_18850 [Neoasaia chiangmaiensis]
MGKRRRNIASRTGSCRMRSKIWAVVSAAFGEAVGLGGAATGASFAVLACAAPTKVRAAKRKKEERNIPPA